jgi:hypothetical protein
MKIMQLSLFVENRPGHLLAPCEVLAKAGIDIVTLSLADTQKFGLLRLIVRDWQKAREVLQQAGLVVAQTEVLGVEVPDHPGGLAEVLRVIGQAGVNVEYMYAFTEKLNDRAVLVFRFDDPDRALAALGQSQVNVISQIELYEKRG